MLLNLVFNRARLKPLQLPNYSTPLNKVLCSLMLVDNNFDVKENCPSMLYVLPEVL